MEQRGCFARRWTMIGIVLVAFLASAKCQNSGPTKPPETEPPGGNNTCSGLTCQNGGSCKAENNSYTCNCTDRHTGAFCENTTLTTAPEPTPTAPKPTTAAPGSGNNISENTIWIVTMNVTFDLDSKVRLFCKASIEAPATMKWYKNGHKETILGDRNFTSADYADGGYFKIELLFNQVSLGDKGFYSCEATHRNVTLHTTYLLRVTDPTGIAGPIKPPAGQQIDVTLTVTLTVVSVLLVFLLGFVCIRHRRHLIAQRDDAHHNATRNPVFEGLENDQDNRYLSVNATCWEISPKRIDLHNILGSGTFGEVWKAVVVGLRGTQGTTTVAVKKLKHNSSDSEKESLALEIELGQSLNGDRHSNIVNFLGCVSTSAPMMLVLEYAPHGDLLGYLRKSRGMEDKYYSCPEACQQEVTPYDLLSFSQQIASGMSFLASKNILHRDLAARNVLVGEGRICKITDFGLALIRDKYQYLYCTAIRKGRLPIKWTAPEHLFTDTDAKDVRVSEKSDVWSYGIVLYEIFTLGGVPYPGWGEWKVVYELKINKYRMIQPQHVTEEIYQIMLDCWNEDPNSRPTFDGLHEMTTAFLQDEHYIDLDMSKYEASLYANVDEIGAAVTQATDPTSNDASANQTTTDPNETLRSSALVERDTPL